ncbi:heme-copper oxidase family protein [Acetobacter fallax]|uniref:Cytochrome oxidase subunit I profile domain-containing protein n=1 Tax=Acetobacter fallax TaxID=1737473 RepID=A0ABX0K948_9PROT|nr:hypothetical protein [Acetobacter fallax]NHO31496.1 hypothetical protein [Acetobacter fallax]NHO35055.1 hypothetical protein [Acetobacter fallax]
MTQAPDTPNRAESASFTAPVPAISTASLSLAVAVGSIAGISGILQEAGVLSDGLTRQMAWFHPVAMLLFVAVPAFLGGFGRLFLARDLADPMLENGGLARLSRLDAASLSLLLLSLLTFIAGGGAASLVATGLLLWSAGAILLATSTVTTILDSRARSGCVVSRGQVRSGAVPPFSLFTWTQLFAATSLLFVAPVLAASATHAFFGQAGIENVLPSFSMPVTLIVLVAAFGLAARIFDSVAPLSSRIRLTAAAIAGLASDGGAVIWARGLFAHQPQFLITLAGTGLAAAMSLIFAGLWVRALWHQTVSVRTRAGVPVLWASAFFVLLAAGWGVQMSSGQGLHAAVLSGAVFVLFGAFYNWLETASEGRYSVGLARLQFGLLFAGAILSAAGGLSARGPVQMTGDVAMAGSLAIFVAVIAGAMKRHRHEIRHQNPALSGSAGTR